MCRFNVMRDFAMAKGSAFPKRETHKNLDKTNCLVSSDNIYDKGYPRSELW